jgi:hypothetical protein
MMPAAGKELAAPPPLCASRCPLHLLHRHIHHELLLVYSGFILPHTSVPSYVNMVFDAIRYNPVIYVMFV